MLKYYHAEVMAVDEWHANGPQDLVTVCLCIQIAIDKMQLCLLSVVNSCPYYNPTTSMGYSVHTLSAVVRPVGRTVKFSKMTLEAVYGREMNIQFSGNSSGGHSCSQHANCMLPQLETSVALCCATKLHI